MSGSGGWRRSDGWFGLAWCGGWFILFRKGVGRRRGLELAELALRAAGEARQRDCFGGEAVQHGVADVGLAGAAEAFHGGILGADDTGGEHGLHRVARAERDEGDQRGLAQGGDIFGGCVGADGERFECAAEHGAEGGGVEWDGGV